MMSSTQNPQLTQRTVGLTVGLSITQDQVGKFLNEFLPFKRWLNRMNNEPRFNLRSLELQTVDMFGPRIGFAKFKTEILNEVNKPIPGIVFMRGGAVSILVILTCENVDYTILTIQPRVPIGEFECAELPAGMIDNDHNFIGVAAKELKEETGIEIRQEQLVDLGQLAWGDNFQGLLPSAGGCDETIKMFLYRTNITREQLDNIEGRATGVLEEGETIKLKVVRLDELWENTSDCKALSSLLLYEKLKISGRLPAQNQ